LSKWFNC